MSTGGRRGAEKSTSSLRMMRSTCAGLVILYSDELDFRPHGGMERRAREKAAGAAARQTTLRECLLGDAETEQEE